MTKLFFSFYLPKESLEDIRALIADIGGKSLPASDGTEDSPTASGYCDWFGIMRFKESVTPESIAANARFRQAVRRFGVFSFWLAAVAEKPFGTEAIDEEAGKAVEWNLFRPWPVDVKPVARKATTRATKPKDQAKNPDVAQTA